MKWRFKPARDLGLPLARRLRSLGREPGLWSLAMHTVWRSCVWLYLKVFHRLRVSGREHIPADTPFVMVANHGSYLDAPCLIDSLPFHLSRRAYALAAGDVFFGSLPAAGFAAFAMNALPVWRQYTTAGDLDLLRRRLVEDGLVLILFPEGTRSRSGEMAHFRLGIGALVAASAVPVVPCFIRGAFAAWPPGRLLPRPRAISVSIGVPIAFAEAANDRTGWCSVAETCEQAVRGLAEPLTAAADPV